MVLTIAICSLAFHVVKALHIEITIPPQVEVQGQAQGLSCMYHLFGAVQGCRYDSGADLLLCIVSTSSQ